jgi:hypothetical protein
MSFLYVYASRSLFQTVLLQVAQTTIKVSLLSKRLYTHRIASHCIAETEPARRSLLPHMTNDSGY